MEKDVARRPQSMLELAGWLSSLEQPVLEPAPTPPPESRAPTVQEVPPRSETLLSAPPQQVTPPGIVVPPRALERRYRRSVGLGPVLFGTMVLIASVAAVGVRLTRPEVAYVLTTELGPVKMDKVRAASKRRIAPEVEEEVAPERAPSASAVAPEILPLRIPGPLPVKSAATAVATALPVGLRDPFGDP